MKYTVKKRNSMKLLATLNFGDLTPVELNNPDFMYLILSEWGTKLEIPVEYLFRGMYEGFTNNNYKIISGDDFIKIFKITGTTFKIVPDLNKD